jgi:hypothetical protein
MKFKQLKTNEEHWKEFKGLLRNISNEASEPL